jgi:hypothetical protein
MIEYVESYLEQLHCCKEVCSQLRASKFTKKAAEAMKMQHTLGNRAEWKSDPARNSLSAAAWHHHWDENQRQIVSKIPQYLLHELDSNFVQIQLLNPLSDHVSQLGSLFNARSELPARPRSNPKQVYLQLNFDENVFKMLRRKPNRRCFSIASWIRSIENIVVMMKCLYPKPRSGE